MARPSLIAILALVLVAIATMAIVWKLGSKDESTALARPTFESTANTRLEARPQVPAERGPSREAIASDGSTEIAAPAPDGTPRTTNALGTLVVTLSDGKTPVRGGSVRLTDPKGDQPQERLVAAETGSATFEQLAPGNYRILVDRVPEGWLPPRILSRKGPRDFIETSVRSGPNAFEIVLERPVRVFGKVFGADGEPVDGVTVRFATLDGERDRRSANFEFQVRAGAYEGDIYDGLWAATPHERYEQAGEQQTLPVPQVRRLVPGSRTEIDFAYERATGVLAGRVLDEHGQPFAGVTVYGHRLVPVKEPQSGQGFQIPQWSGRDMSGEDGSFTINALAFGRYRILVDAEGYTPVAAPGQNKIGAEVAPVEVEVGADGPTRKDLTVPRSRLVRVHGRVMVNAIWASAEGVSGRTPTINLIVGPTREGASSTRHMIDGAGGRFDFLVEVAAIEPRLELMLGSQRTTHPLALSPDVELAPLDLHFPN